MTLNALLSFPRLAAQVDREFLRTINEGFNSGALSSDSWRTLVLVLSLLVVLLAAALLVNFIRRRILSRDIPSGWILGRSEIRSLLETAVANRATMEMRFLPSDRSRRSTYLSPMDLTRETLVLEMTGAGSVGRNWLDRPVECFFRLRHKRDQFLHYAFTTTILGVNKPDVELALLSLEIPKKMELHQKRAFLRVDPPQQYVLGLALWPDQTGRGQDSLTNIKRWGKPILTLVPGRSDNPLLILNISAGGMRLLVRHALVRGKNVSFSIAARFMAMLDIYDPDNVKKLRFWFLCRVQNLYEDFETRNQEVGLQFVDLGRLKDPEEEMLNWQPVHGQGVDSLEAWVMKRHLEIFRRTGLT